VLDKNFQPCKISAAKEIIPLVCVEKAKVLDQDFNQHTFEDWIIYSEFYIQETGEMENVFVRSPSIRMLVPEVIILTDYTRNPLKDRKLRFSRQNIFKRDNYTCQYCSSKNNRKELTIDHIIPKSKGGPTNWTNITTACFKCNIKKANRTPQEANIKLLSQPTAPSWKDQMEIMRGKNPLWEKLL
jgi:5-methylcytosine-specific restriction endonuclease McrA